MSGLLAGGKRLAAVGALLVILAAAAVLAGIRLARSLHSANTAAAAVAPVDNPCLLLPRRAVEALIGPALAPGVGDAAAAGTHTCYYVMAAGQPVKTVVFGLFRSGARDARGRVSTAADAFSAAQARTSSTIETETGLGVSAYWVASTQTLSLLRGDFYLTLRVQAADAQVAHRSAQALARQVLSGFDRVAPALGAAVLTAPTPVAAMAATPTVTSTPEATPAATGTPAAAAALPATPAPVAEPESPPAIPENLHATEVDTTRIQFTWEPSPGAAGYWIVASTDIGTELRLTDTSYSLAGLQPGGRYCLTISAYQATGYSDWSAWNCVTTPNG